MVRCTGGGGETWGKGAGHGSLEGLALQKLIADDRVPDFGTQDTIVRKESLSL